MLMRRNLVLGITGGVLYYAVETLMRGYSHWTMFLLGGLCFVLIGSINELLPWEMPLYQQMLIGGAMVTVLEFVAGCVVNLWLGWNVWDYSGEWGNILGQIAPKWSALWVLISGAAILLDDWLRWWYGEEPPHYKMW